MTEQTTPQPSLAERLATIREAFDHGAPEGDVCEFFNEWAYAATAEIERMTNNEKVLWEQLAEAVKERDAAREEAASNRRAAEEAMRQMSEACSKLGRAEGEACAWKMRSEHAELALAHAKATALREAARDVRIDWSRDYEDMAKWLDRRAKEVKP